MDKEELSRALNDALGRMFAQSNFEIEKKPSDHEVLVKDLDGKTIAEYRQFTSTCKEIKTLASTFMNTVQKAMALREAYWRGVMAKYPEVNQACHEGRPMTMCKDDDGQITISVGPLPEVD